VDIDAPAFLELLCERIEALEPAAPASPSK
jgi:hypothetical protein